MALTGLFFNDNMTASRLLKSLNSSSPWMWSSPAPAWATPAPAAETPARSRTPSPGSHRRRSPRSALIIYVVIPASLLTIWLQELFHNIEQFTKQAKKAAESLESAVEASRSKVIQSKNAGKETLEDMDIVRKNVVDDFKSALQKLGDSNDNDKDPHHATEIEEAEVTSSEADPCSENHSKVTNTDSSSCPQPPLEPSTRDRVQVSCDWLLWSQYWSVIGPVGDSGGGHGGLAVHPACAAEQPPARRPGGLRRHPRQPRHVHPRQPDPGLHRGAAR